MGECLFIAVIFTVILLSFSCSEVTIIEPIPGASIPIDFSGSFDGEKVALSWGKSSAGTEIGYELWRYDDGISDYKIIDETNAEVFEYDDYDVSGGSEYTYKIRGKFADFTGEFSREIEISTGLPAPINLAAVYNGTALILSWEPVENSAPIGYEIWRSVGSDDNYVQIGTTGEGITEYFDEGVAIGNTYYYKVKAVYTLGISDFSEELRAQISEFVYAGYWTFGDSYHAPRAVSTAPNGNVYVTDAFDGKIYYFTADGVYVGEWSYEYDPASDIAVSPDGNRVYISESGFCEISMFSNAGDFLGVVGTGNPGSGDGDFAYPFGVATAPNGNVYVADMQNHRVQYFTTEGQYIGQWGSFGSGTGQFDSLHGIGVAANGDVYVCEWGNSRVQYFTSTGDYLGNWGSYGSGDGQFDSPFCVAVSPDNGDVFVAECDRIQYFDPTGLYKGDVGFCGSGFGGFASVGGICLSPDGNRVYVGDHITNSVHYYDKLEQFR